MILGIIRTLILFSVVVIGLRLMGKRQIGQLQPYELVIVIMLSALAAIPMENTGVPLISGLIPILTLIVLHVALSVATLKSEKARGVICGTPSVLIENGKIVQQELSRLRYNINELMEQLRAKNMPNIADVEFAILETSGQLSVIPKSQKRPLIPEDMNLPTKYEGLPVTLIIDGYVFHKNLAKINLNEDWLRAELQKFNIKNFKDVLFASLDSEGKLFFQPKAEVI
ncbi:MAG: membrane protein [Peptococcaceae bacterium BRH_c4a]|nr:MAG: membrane protein [Peptococcaceae bacterium BRH_c4a]